MQRKRNPIFAYRCDSPIAARRPVRPSSLLSDRRTRFLISRHSGEEEDRLTHRIVFYCRHTHSIAPVSHPLKLKMGAKYSKRTMEISSTPVKPGPPDSNGKVTDDVTVEKVEDKVAANGETKAVEETNGSAKKEGDDAVKAEEAGEKKEDADETKEEEEKEADKTTGEFTMFSTRSLISV